MNAGLAITTLLFFLICFFAGLLLVIRAAYRYLLVQKIKNLPTSKVRSAAIGLVELYGKAKCKKIMLSPISRKRCVYWDISAQYRNINDKWIGLYGKDASPRFYLEDETGKIVINQKGAKLETPHDHIYEGYIKGGKVLWVRFEKIAKPVMEFIKRLPREDRKEFMDHATNELRIFERYIAEGDNIYVLGDAEIQKDVKSHIGHLNLIIENGKSDIMYITDSHERKIVEDIRICAIKDLLAGLTVSSFFLWVILKYLSV